MNLYHCDNCHAPMVNARHFSAESCAHGDTDQCLLCTTGDGRIPNHSSDLEDEIIDLARFATAPAVSGRLVALAMELDAAYQREAAQGDRSDDAPMATREGVQLDPRAAWPFPDRSRT